jgi:hypothetical protein
MEVDFMYIKKDFSYISTNETMLMDKGYGKMSVHSIHFDRHYSEEQMEKNRLLELEKDLDCMLFKVIVV